MFANNEKCFPKASFLGHSTERQSIVNHYTVNPITKATTSVVVFMENALFNSELWKMQVELKYIFGSRNLQL